MAGRITSEGHPQRIEWRQRQIRAIELRVAGKTYEEIAKETGYSDESHVREGIKRGLRFFGNPPAEELRDLEREKLRAMWEKTYRRFDEAKSWQEAVATGNLLVRIQDRESKLDGLDQPRKVNLRALMVATAAKAGLSQQEMSEALDLAQRLNADAMEGLLMIEGEVDG